MIEYFKEQLQTTPPLDIDGAKSMISARVANGGDEAKLTEYFTSKIGKRLVFFIADKNTDVDTNIKRVEIMKCFEDEIDDTFKNATFDSMSGTSPRFIFNQEKLEHI